METVGINPEDFRTDRQAEMDAQLLVKFYVKAVQDKEASLKEGRPIFKDVEYIDIRAPGSRDNVARPASPHDKSRFAKHYKAFKERTSDDEVVEGTLLAEWPLISRSQVEELGFFNVKTVEQLVNMSDANAQRFMGIHALKRKASEWLERVKVQQEADELAAELAKRDEEIAELRKMVEDMQKPKTRKKKVTAKKE